ncbi:MAG: aminoacyl-tRNA hydrolase [bacterium]
MKIIIGLGNPGAKYAKTRHNVGWMILDELSDGKWHESKKSKAMYLKTEIDGEQVELIKPLTFMNNSGHSVSHTIKNHNLKLDKDLIVIHDDKDIELGKIKVQADRSSAGHKGVQSIIQQLGTQNFIRVRVGIANKKSLTQSTDKFVLKKFGWLEKTKLKQTIDQAVLEIKKLL